ncbi:ABC transporter ATP-binding protein [Streptomyces sp. NPDC004752]
MATVSEDRPVLEAQDLTKRFPGAETPVLQGVSLTLRAGQVHGLVGESGSGKSTLSRCLCFLGPFDHGVIRLNGEFFTTRDLPARKTRRTIQMVFQDPWSAFDPRMRIAQSLKEALHGRRFRSAHMLEEHLTRAMENVGLDQAALHRYPQAFSGGQLQRINVARALLAEPSVIVADEAVSALDVSIQAQVVNLLLDNCRTFGTALLFVSHDLALVSRVASEVTVLLNGEVVDRLRYPSDIPNANADYTRQLWEAAVHPVGTENEGRM